MILRTAVRPGTVHGLEIAVMTKDNAKVFVRSDEEGDG